MAFLEGTGGGWGCSHAHLHPQLNATISLVGKFLGKSYSQGLSSFYTVESFFSVNSLFLASVCLEQTKKQTNGPLCNIAPWGSDSQSKQRADKHLKRKTGGKREVVKILDPFLGI